MSSPQTAKAVDAFVSQHDNKHVLECESDSLSNIAYFEGDLPACFGDGTMHGTYYIGNTINSTLVLKREHTLRGHNHLNFYPSNSSHPSSIQIDADQSYRGCTIVHRSNADCSLAVNATLFSSFIIVGSNDPEIISSATLRGCGTVRGKVQVQSSGILEPNHHSEKQLTLLNGLELSKSTSKESHATLKIKISGTGQNAHTCIVSAKPVTFGRGSRIQIELKDYFEFQENRQYRFQIIRGLKTESPKIHDMGVEVILQYEQMKKFMRYVASFDANSGSLSVVTGPFRKDFHF